MGIFKKHSYFVHQSWKINHIQAIEHKDYSNPLRT